MDSSTLPREPGLYEIASGHAHQDPAGRWRAVTNVRRLDGDEVSPGSALTRWAAWLLAVLAAGVLGVSYAGQFVYIYAARHQVVASNVEAGMFDVGMIILALLALGLAIARKSSRAERFGIMACALGSAAMNYAAADVTSPRSVLVYVAPPLFLAYIVDRVIAVIRRHRLGDDEASPWAPLGQVLLKVARLIGLVLLYSLRFALAASETARGLRQMVLDAAPLPGLQAPEKPEAIGPPSTKKAALLALYRQHRDYGNRAAASKVAAELAPQAGLQAGTARAYLYAELDGRTS